MLVTMLTVVNTGIWFSPPLCPPCVLVPSHHPVPLCFCGELLRRIYRWSVSLREGGLYGAEERKSPSLSGGSFSCKTCSELPHHHGNSSSDLGFVFEFALSMIYIFLNQES